mmetsp:Transcript_4571/g.13205  ORF Transcript_4571/g.13205 Transcript_4571/m.13205 type:complete len:205 (+) Transcript_4571:3202-3816(+)
MGIGRQAGWHTGPVSHMDGMLTVRATRTLPLRPELSQIAASRSLRFRVLRAWSQGCARGCAWRGVCPCDGSQLSEVPRHFFCMAIAAWSCHTQVSIHEGGCCLAAWLMRQPSSALATSSGWRIPSSAACSHLSAMEICPAPTIRADLGRAYRMPVRSVSVSCASTLVRRLSVPHLVQAVGWCTTRASQRMKSSTGSSTRDAATA